jgi:GNAT superfamily N-acetyltransferase
MIKEITFEQCLPMWEVLWKDRVSPFSDRSAMLLPSYDQMVLGMHRLHTTHSENIGEPTFLGYFDGDQLVGVNSYHEIMGTIRSRGLYVLDSHRGKGIASQLLGEVIRRAPVEAVVWSFPNAAAFNVYIRAGFEKYSEALWDNVENKTNFYVMTVKK